MARPKNKPIPKLTEQETTRFHSKVDKRGPDECWLWTGNVCGGEWRNRNGRTGIRMPYGKFSYGTHGFLVAHRVAFFLATGIDPVGFNVCHDCPTGDNPRCCNPAHLWMGTDADNAADRHAKGRDATGDSSGARTHPEKWKRGAESAFSKHPELRAKAQQTLREHPELRCRGDDHWTRLEPERVVQGEAHYRAKVTADIVRELRRRYADGGVTYNDLASPLGLTAHAVFCIIKRKTWKHV